MGLKPKGAKTKRKDGLGEKKERATKEKGTYKVVYPMTVRRVCTALVITDNIAAGFFVVVVVIVIVVRVQTRYDHTPVCALGRQAWARLWRALAIAFCRTVAGVDDGRRNEPVFVEGHCCMVFSLS